jgi:hypothetical protein
MYFLTGLEITKRLAFGAASAAALARSRTIDALVLKRSIYISFASYSKVVSAHTITSHAWLPGNTCWDENDLRSGQAFS